VCCSIAYGTLHNIVKEFIVIRYLLLWAIKIFYPNNHVQEFDTGLDARIGCWMLEVDAFDVLLLSFHAVNGCWHWMLALDAGIGCWYMTLALDAGIGCWHWMLVYDSGVRCWQWMLA
jgi:hypothetical protein